MSLSAIVNGTPIEMDVRINGKGVPLGGEMVESAFSTGSRGYQSSGKVTLNGKSYQCNFQLVEIGSKPGSTVGKNGPVIVTRPAK